MPESRTKRSVYSLALLYALAAFAALLIAWRCAPASSHVEPNTEQRHPR